MEQYSYMQRKADNKIQTRDYSLQAKSVLHSVFINRIRLKHNNSHLDYIYLWLLLYTYHRGQYLGQIIWLKKSTIFTKVFTICPFTKSLLSPGPDIRWQVCHCWTAEKVNNERHNTRCSTPRKAHCSLCHNSIPCHIWNSSDIFLHLSSNVSVFPSYYNKL